MATSVLTIEELSGDKRRLTLKGAALPFRGASWAGRTVVSTTWNNGNSEATQQVLVSQLLPSDWEGIWRTTQLLRTPCEYEGPEGSRKVALAYNLFELVELIREAGQLLRVTWVNQAARGDGGSGGGVDTHTVSRLGRLVEFDAPHDTLDDIKWKASFEWVSKGDSSPKSVDFRGDDLIGATRAAIQNQDAVAKAVAQNLLRAMEANGFRKKNYTNTFSLGQLEQMANAPLAIVDSFADTANAFSNRLKKVGDLVLKTRSVPFAIAGRALDVANNAVAVATSFCDEVSQRCPEQQVLGSKLSMVTRTASYFSDVQTQAQLMERANSLLAQQARVRKSAASGQSQPLVNAPKAGDVFEVYIPRDGDTMTSIAYRKYQADVAAQICKVNGLPSQTIRPPRRRPLILPTLAVLEARGQQST